MPPEDVLRKLRVKQGDRAAVIGAPPSYGEVLAALESVADVTRDLTGQFDFIHYFATEKAALEREASLLKAALKPGAILWVSYPKGTAIPTDLKRDSLRESLDQFGLTAVSQIAIDDVWSALRFKPA